MKTKKPVHRFTKTNQPPGYRKSRKGRKNKKTIEREKVEQIVRAYQGGFIKTLATGALDEMMCTLLAYVRKYQPLIITADGNYVENPEADEGKFERYTDMVRQFAGTLAPYQSPTYKAVMHTLPDPLGDGATNKRGWNDVEVCRRIVFMLEQTTTTTQPQQPPIIEHQPAPAGA